MTTHRAERRDPQTDLSSSSSSSSSLRSPRGDGPRRLDRFGPWLGLVARLVLGGVLLVAGLLKVGEPLVAARAAQAYQILPFELAGYVGVALPVIEIVLGTLLVLGLFTRPAAVGGTLLMLVFTAAIASVWARGIHIDCGCFGDGGSVAPDETQYPLDIARDLALAALGAWLIVRPRTPFSLDGRLSPERTLA